jgi:hypothetical protein
MRRLSDMSRLACDHCGAHHTREVTAGQTCPLCGIGKLHPIDPIPPRRPAAGRTADTGA